MPWAVVRRPSLTFSIFDIYRTVSRIELKVNVRYVDNMEIPNCCKHSVPISKMAILKFFKRQLP